MQIRWAYWKRVVAGAIFGLYMAHLLYFLNPQIDVSAGRLLFVTLVYGLTCGFLFGTILWLLRLLRVRIWGRSEEYRTHGFGFIVLAAFISSLIYWFHLRVVRIYLPIGAVRILSKATIVITVAAFLLLVLWVIERSADRRTSRLLFAAAAVLIAISSFFLYQRRESYRTDHRDVVVANVGTVAGHRPTILIAVRNLPYDWILTVAGEGGVPSLDALRQRSYFARVEPFSTTSPSALWASMATGKLPFRHGVTGRYSYRTLLNGPDPRERFLLLPSGVAFYAWGLIPPVERLSAVLPAGDSHPLWKIYESVEFDAAVINWPGVRASEAALVVTDLDIRRDARVPRSPGIAQRFNNTGRARERILAGLAADERALGKMREAIDGNTFALNAVALEGFSEAQRGLHIFTNELADRGTMKGAALRAYMEWLDREIGEIAKRFPEHLLVIVSPSGVVAPRLPQSAYELAMRAIAEDDTGASDGMLLMSGRNIVHNNGPATSFVTDIVPTILFSAGMPLGRDMDGGVRTDAFADEFLRQHVLSAIPSYEAKRVVVQRPGT